LTQPSDGPFPADRFTVADPAQNTCERINLANPVCDAASWECSELALLNELDGFSLSPRVAIPFNGPIDVSTVDNGSVFFVKLGSSLVNGVPDFIAPDDDDTEDDDDPASAEAGWVVGINRRVWHLAGVDPDPDPRANTLYVVPDEPLEEHTRYALFVTRAVHDASGSRFRSRRASSSSSRVATEIDRPMQTPR